MRGSLPGARRSRRREEANLPGSEVPVKVRVSAPLRVDCGNALDLETIAAIMQPYRPCTVNIAVNLRVEVTVEPRGGTGIVVDDELAITEFRSLAHLSLTGPTRLAAVVLHHFQLEGILVTIRSPVLRGSGLGGSGAVVISLVAACRAYLGAPEPIAVTAADLSGMAMLAQYLEVAITSAPVGIQDHLAAAFGGVALWEWEAPDRMPPFRRIQLGDMDTLRGLNSRLLVGLLDEQHAEGGLSLAWAESVRQGELVTWIRTVRSTRDFADAIRTGQWPAAGTALAEECELRAGQWPQVMKGPAAAFRSAVISAGGAARFCGGGDGGAVWGLIDPHLRQEFMDTWTADPACSGVQLVTPAVDTEGLVIECTPV